MARFKHYDYNQAKLVPIDFDAQIIPGTFEHTLCYLVEHEFDLSMLEDRYRNDETGAPAYDPAILLKVILYAYSRGVTSSREIARYCRENVVFMALSADSRPHFTTIASFVSRLGDCGNPLNGRDLRNVRAPIWLGPSPVRKVWITSASRPTR